MVMVTDCYTASTADADVKVLRQSRLDGRHENAMEGRASASFSYENSYEKKGSFIKNANESIPGHGGQSPLRGHPVDRGVLATAMEWSKTAHTVVIL